jgi:hypothetical protein
VNATEIARSETSVESVVIAVFLNSFPISVTNQVVSNVPLGLPRYLCCLSRICAGGWVGLFGFETVVGGFFNLPGPTTLRGGAAGLGWDFPIDCGFFPESQ